MIVRSVHVAFEDERGTISDVFYDQTINHVARIVSNDGSLRGKALPPKAPLIPKSARCP
jgi:hypothetical protein